MPAISVYAPSKTILVGEHAVVYNRPAIALPIDNLQTNVIITANPLGKENQIAIFAPNINLKQKLSGMKKNNPIHASISIVKDYLKIDHYPSFEIRINSCIPIAAGLGSSASMAVAIIHATGLFFGVNLPTQTICDLAFEVEKIIHGNPSGIDNSVIAFDQPIYFQREKPIEILHIKKSFFLIIGNSGIRGITKEAVLGVKNRWMTESKKYEGIFDSIGQITIEARNSIETGLIENLGALMVKNHGFLQQLGVSCAKLDNLVSAALKAGAQGAKLCGAGLGGNMIALVDYCHIDPVKIALQETGAVEAYTAKFEARE